MVNPQVTEARRELNAIYEISKTLATSLDVAKTFREALNYLLHAQDWRRAFVVLSGADDQLLSATDRPRRTAPRHDPNALSGALTIGRSALSSVGGVGAKRR